MWHTLASVENLDSERQRTLCQSLLAVGDAELLVAFAQRDDLDTQVRETLMWQGGEAVQLELLQRGDVTESDLRAAAASDSEHVQRMLITTHPTSSAVSDVVERPGGVEALAAVVNGEEVPRTLRLQALELLLCREDLEKTPLVTKRIYRQFAHLVNQQGFDELLLTHAPNPEALRLLCPAATRVPGERGGELWTSAMVKVSGGVDFERGRDEVANMLIATLSSMWTRSEVVATATTIAAGIRKELDDGGGEREDNAVLRSKLDEVEHLLALNNRTPVGDLLAQAGFVDDHQAVILAETITRDERWGARRAVFGALCERSDLEVSTLLDVWAAFELGGRDFDDDYMCVLEELINSGEYPEAVGVLGCVLGVAGAETQDIQDIAVTLVASDALPFAVEVTDLHTLCGPYLKSGHLSHLTAALVAELDLYFSKNQTFRGGHQREFARALNEALAGTDVSVWLQLGRLAPGFRGTFGELLAACKAAVR